MSVESPTSSGEHEDPELLTAERDLLQGENERLRRALLDMRRTRHRRATVALAVLGAIALLGAFAFPPERTVLIALGGTGLFTATLTQFLRTERFVSADIGERVYEALVSDHESVISELGLQDERVYVPTDEAGGVRLFVPQHSEYAVPPDSEIGSTFVITDDSRYRGMAFDPTGRGLLTDLESTITGDPSEDPTALTEQIADGVVEEFELARSASTDVDPESGRATIEIGDSTYGSIEQFDHPIASLFAVTFATVLDQPVTLDVYDNEEATEQFIKCTWDGNA